MNEYVVCLSWAFDVEDEGQNNEGDKGKIEPKLLLPAHVAEYAATGTRYPVKEAQEYCSDINGIEEKQRKRKIKPHALCPGEQQTAHYGNFRRRKTPDEELCQPAGKPLVIHIPTECLQVQHLAGSCIHEKQYEQCDNSTYGITFFHRNRIRFTLNQP